MVNSRRFLGVFAALLAVLASVIQAASFPTPEQIQAFQQLPAAQRKAILDSLRGTGQKQKGPTNEVPERFEPRDKEHLFATDSKLSVPKLKAGDTLLIRIRPEEKKEQPEDSKAGAKGEPKPEPPREPELTPEQKLKMDAAQKVQQARLPAQEVFVLDQFGILRLNNIGNIQLAGLNEQEAAERIAAEPALKGLQVFVKLLPLEQALKPFGYDIFSNPKSFSPDTEIPVPADYVVGPGDTVVIQLFGKENVQHELEITRDGMLLFPEIGPIPVAGMKFSQLQQEIQDRVQKQLIGAKASVTLGQLRSLRVFVLGDVERPGSYAIGGLASLTHALMASGGPKRIGSLRQVQVKRSGKIVSRVDLYDLLLRGDNRADARLLPGDVILVPPVGKTAGVAGRVRRPGIYELKDEKTLGELIELAGGLSPDAFQQDARIERVVANRERTVLGVDLTEKGARQTELRDGDVITIYSILDRLQDTVRLSGHVVRPGDFQWKPNMRLTDVIPSTAELLPEVDTRYVLIKRENLRDRSVELRGASLLAAFEKPQSDANIVLQPGDEIHVFGLLEDRGTLIKPLLEKARTFSSPDRPVREVNIEGAVHYAGQYPWVPEMKVSDLLAAAGGLTDRAYLLEAELTRFTLVDGKERDQVRQNLDLGTILRGDASADATLKPYDRLMVRRIPKWDEEGAIEIAGEVRFPGKYPIARGERLSKILKRAGGISDQAYPKGAIFLRESVRMREQEHLERLTAQLERDLVLVSTEGPEVGVRKETALAEGQALLKQMRSAKARGRMVIKVDAVLDVREGYDLVVQPGDKLFIPQRPEEVTVLGEVYHPTSHLFIAEYKRNEYVQLSGGVTQRGNKRAVYVVHADGSVSPPGHWLFGGNVDVGPGDSIIVPLKVDRIGNLKLFTDISTILFQLAVTAAALDAIGIL